MNLLTRICLLLFATALSASYTKAQVASFTVSAASGCSPLVVYFTNTSTGGTSYIWNFDNGDPPDIRVSPSTSYYLPGTYVPTLTAYSGTSSSVFTTTITVLPSPTVNFTVSDTAVCPGTPITFTSTTVAGVPGTVIYSWNFGDGSTGTGSPVSHSYTTPGRDPVTLWATNADGCMSHLDSPGIILNYTPPVTTFSALTTFFCSPPALADFTSVVTGTPPYTYVWKFGDLTPPSTLANPPHLYGSPGDYSVKVTVTDAHSCSDSVTRSNYIFVGTDTASFSYPDTVCIFSAATFINTSGTHIASSWVFGDGHTATTNDGVNTYTAPGPYNVTLTITDSTCENTVSHSVYVRPGPVVSFSQYPAVPCPFTPGYTTSPVTLTFTGIAPPGVVLNWLFGDGGTGSGSPATHTFANRGIDTIRMIAYDPVTGCADTVDKIDTLYDLIHAYAYDPNRGCIPLTVNFYTTANTYEPPPDTLTQKPYPFDISYTWNFGDGATTTGANPVHTFTAVGIFHGYVTTYLPNGCTLVDSLLTAAGTPPVVTFSVTPVRVCYNQHDSLGYTLITGPITNVVWTFSDASTESDSGIWTSFRPNLPGIFSVSVTPYYNGCAGPTEYKNNYIIIDSPLASLAQIVGCSPHTDVIFTDKSVGDDTHIWFFGDGDSSHAANPIHTYSATGSYSVLLATSNIRSGCRDTTVGDVEFTKLYPAFSTPDTDVCPGLVSINGTVTGGAPNSYAWFIDGNFKSETALFSYIYSPGIYDIMLIVTDVNHCPDTVIKTAYLHVAKPVTTASTDLPYQGCLPLTVTFTDHSTDIAGVSFTNYFWSFGDGDSVNVTSGTVTHTYTTVATFPIRELVTDNFGCADTSTLFMPVTVFPIPVTSFTVNDSTPCLGSPVTFTNTTPPFIASANWFFGDGESATGSSSVSHTYQQSGLFTDTLVVKNFYNCTDTAIYSRFVHVTKPVASFTMDDSFSVCPPLTVHFTNTSSGAASYSWIFGDGNHSPFASPVNPFTAVGLDTVTMIATNSYGCKDTTYSHVSVYGYNGAFSYTNDSGCVPYTVHFYCAFGAGVPHITWDFADVTFTTAYSDTITHIYTSPGFYTPKLYLTNDTGCSSISVGLDTIKVYGVPVVDSIISPAYVCQNTTVTVADSTRGGLWSVPGANATIGSINGMVTGLSEGTALITYKVTNWCGSSDTFKIIKVNPKPYAGVITGPASVCVGGSISLMDTISGTWTESNTGIAALSAGLVTALKAGTDTIHFIMSNICGIDTASKLITVNPLPYPGAIMGHPLICVGSPDSLTDSGYAGGGVWSTSNPTAIIDSNKGTMVASTAGAVIITFTTLPDTNACVNDTTYPLTVISPFSVSPTVTQVTCYDSNNASITTALTGKTYLLKYTWSTNDSTTYLKNLRPGTYSLDVRDLVSQCAWADSFQVTQPDSLAVTARVSFDTCNSGMGSIVADVSGGTSPYNYLWSNNTSSSEITGLHPGSYTLLVSDHNNCAINPGFIVPDTCNEIIVHDVITPNGDGINDVWVIEGIENYHNNTVAIFDKWGNLLFQQTDYHNDWYGRDDKGQLLPDGTYFYLVKLNQQNTTGGENVFKGAILIKR